MRAHDDHTGRTPLSHLQFVQYRMEVRGGAERKESRRRRRRRRLLALATRRVGMCISHDVASANWFEGMACVHERAL